MFSGLLLRRCVTCRAPIAGIHVGMEVASAGLVATAFALAPPIAAAAWSVAGLLLLTLAVFDWRDLWLPDALTLPLAVVGLLGGGLASGAPTPDRVIGGAAGWATLALLGVAFRRLRGVDGLGGGDPKLAGAIGCWIGWTPLPALWALAGLVGVVLAIARPKPAGGPLLVPFGTALALAAVPAWWLTP